MVAILRQIGVRSSSNCKWSQAEQKSDEEAGGYRRIFLAPSTSSYGDAAVAPACDIIKKEISPPSFEVSEIECDVACKLLILSLGLSDEGGKLGLRHSAFGLGEIAAPKLRAQFVDLIESGHADRLLFDDVNGRRAHEARVKEREATASGGEWGAGFVGAQETEWRQNRGPTLVLEAG